MKIFEIYDCWIRENKTISNTETQFLGLFLKTSLHWLKGNELYEQILNKTSSYVNLTINYIECFCRINCKWLKKYCIDCIMHILHENKILIQKIRVTEFPDLLEIQ